MKIRRLRILIIAGGAFAVVFGFFCLSEIPKYIILNYLSQDEILNAETVNALFLMGTFSVVFGWGAAGLALFWPELIERAVEVPRSELLYRASLIGTNILLFFGLALGIRSMRAYDKILIIVVAGAVLFFVEWKLGRHLARLYGILFNRWVGFFGYLAAGAYFFQLRFPFSTWREYLFSRDYPMFQYTIWLDYKILKQGWLYGWEPNFSAGYPTFLNLRSLLIPYLPFALLPPAVGFHLMIFAIYVSVPYLCYWVAKELSEDRDIAVLAGWAGVWAMTGYMWHILHWGMMPTFASIPFLMLALGFFVRAMRGSRWGVFLSGLFWAPVAYIHLGHFAHVALALFILAALYTWEQRSLRAAWALVRTTVLALLFAAPYLAEFARYRGHVILTNMFAYPAETVMETVRILMRTVSHFVPTLQWHWSARFEAMGFPDYGYFALFSIFFLVVLYLAFSGQRSHRQAGLLYTGAILVAALSFVPKFELSFQRMLYMAPPLMALAVGFWMGEAKKRGHVLPFYIIAILLVFYMRPFTREDAAIPTIPQRDAFDPMVVAKMRELGGNYILFENTASLNPYADLRREQERVDAAWDVHAPGFVFMETGKRLFSHPGYNPHPYYRLRGTYIATGTYEGRDLEEYGHEFFADLWKKWGVEYLVLWSRRAKRFFADAPGYTKVMEGERYLVCRFEGADPRAVETTGGTAGISYPDNFTAEITLDGVPEGTPVIVRANMFPGWRAECGGEPVELYEDEGRIAFDAPASGGTVTMHFPKRPWLFAVPALALLAGIFPSIRRML